MWQASWKGHSEVVELLLDNGADVDTKTYIDGTTALWQAAWHGHIDVVRLLLSAGAEIDAKRDTDRVTALWQASYHGHTDVVKLLLDKGSDVNVRRIPTGTTPLWVASYNGHADIVKLLLAAGADINVNAKATTQSKICTPLATALEKGHMEIVRLLLDNGADVSVEQSIDIEAALWKDARKSHTSRVYEDFLERYPDSESAAEARAKIEKLIAEEKARVQRLEEEKSLRRILAERKVKAASMLADAKTPSQLEELLTREPDMVEFVLPELEQVLLQEIRNNGTGDRFMIKDIKSQGGVEGTGRMTLSVSEFSKNVWSLEMEFQGDSIPIVNGHSIVFGSYFVNRFKGQVEIDAGGGTYTFVSEDDKANRLTFTMVDSIGYVYLRGKGKVILKDGQEVELGYRRALDTTKKVRETLEITSSEKTNDKDSRQTLIQTSDEENVEILKSGTVGYREVVQDNEKASLSGNPKIESKPEDINIKVTTVSAKVSYQSRSQMTENGIFQFRPDPSTTPTGHIEINFIVNDEPKSIKTDVTHIFTLGEDYLYYLFECDNGNAYQSNRSTVIPFVRNMKVYNELDINIAKKLYLGGNTEEKELAIWMIWKLNSGKEIAGILHDLIDVNIDKKRLSANFIALLRIYHPLINQAVQKRLHELEYNTGPIDGSLSTDTIEAIRQFQKDNSIEVTGWLDESTLFKMFATVTGRPRK